MKAMTLTKEQAKLVEEAFGPCTAAYECGLDEGAFNLAVRLDVEDISAERDGYYDEWRAARPAVLARLAKLPFLAPAMAEVL